MLRRSIPALALAMLAAAPGEAAWHRASSTHFVIYADDEPAKLRAFAEKLERFDKAVRTARGMADHKVGEGNRLTVFVVKDVSAVQELKRGNDSGVAGFYRTRATGSVAVVPRETRRQSEMTADAIFFHEYAHHLMFQDLTTPMPPWLVEGFAEFMATAVVEPDGSVGLGAAPAHRARALFNVKNPMPFEVLLGGEPPHTGSERSALYARGWLLAHYLTFSEKRRGQLEAYLGRIAAGEQPVAAAKAAFGDLGALERETEKYLRDDKFAYLTLPAAKLPIAAVAVEPVSPGTAAVMPLLMRLKAGTDAGQAEKLAERLRAAAAPYPADPVVQAALAEIELYAARPAAAEAAADRALAAKPDMLDALILKGRAVLARAKAKEAGASFAAARGWFNRANRVDPEDPEPLLLFYQSFRDEGVPPNANAVAALHYASELAPQDMGLRMTSARLHLAAGRAAAARKLLVPVAFNIHGGKLADEARELVRQIDSAGVPAQAKPL